jgi:glycosyltransferase involved in cell wall biosynthesis
VIVEAMACGVPCVVTEVGDSAWIVGETGAAVPVGDASALARTCLRLLSLPADRRLELGRAARQRVLAHFDIDRAVAAYETLYREAAV